uniref:Hedgehog protein n=1 Tax=Platynereis dumerilii TaxID=6359 RepID=E2FMT1_PLADU|nr:hedgehog [Platynereis dumerilii]
MTSLRHWKIIGEVCLFLFLISTGPVISCGPGRGRGSSRRNRKMTPLVFKQHVPNVSENTLGASGLAEGKISRSDQKFQDLVVNYNPDIIFKNEENTGADRIMTQRCKDKLNTLAIAVMNRWPGVKLRVTEAWDEDLHHTEDSLHYEGRAVDITTSDRDRTKYGMLARLAVEAGFDWVYYESRGHVHCSVKSDSSIAIKTGGCFPSTGLATLSDGRGVTMDALHVGDSVLAMDTDGSAIYSKVVMFMDARGERQQLMYTITTEAGRELTLTPGHMVYSTSENYKDASPKDLHPVFASRIREGDYIFVLDTTTRWQSHRWRPEKVVRLQTSKQNGVFAPLTDHGNMVVDGVLVSCYAMIDSVNIAHWSFAPYRMFSYVQALFNTDSQINTNSSAVTSPPQHGIHWYAEVLHKIGEYVVHKDLWYDS